MKVPIAGVMSFRKFALLAALTLGAAQAAWAADVTGTWRVSAQTPAGAGDLTLTLKQAGETLTGEYKGRFGEAPVIGTMKGNDLTLTYTVNVRNTDLVMKYAGTVDGATISGKLWLGETGEGTFKATRQ